MPKASGGAGDHGGLEPTKQPLLTTVKTIAKDPFREPFRRRAVETPEHAFQTLEPYAHLRLDIIAGRHLLARDYDGRSDPFAEVYLNDELQGTSSWKFFTVNPKWDFHIDLDIYSPLSIVQIRIMDRDNVTQNDLIGFVEFCVADLDPDAEASGWFELRRKRHLHGLAPTRLRAHRKRRDDQHPGRAQGASSAQGASAVGKAKSDGGSAPHRGSANARPRSASPAGVEEQAASPKPASSGSASFDEASQASPSARAAGSKPPALKRCKTAFAMCRGKLPRLEDDNISLGGSSTPGGAGGSSGHAVKDLLHVLAASGVEASAKAGRICRQQRRSIETMIDHAKSILNGEEERPNAGEILLRLRLDTPQEPDDEWFACCFPRPGFQLYPSCHLNLELLYRDLNDIKAMAVHSLQTAACVPHYLLTWQCWQLSATLLSWWWLAALWPEVVLPTVLWWPVILLHLLRQERWQEVMLVHERTAPLNDDGFRAIAKFDNTSRMQVWIQRVVASMGRAVCDERRCSEFAALVARDRRPLLDFERLVKKLGEQAWVYHPSGHPVCPEDHPLVFLGSVGGGRRWSCQNPHGCCNFAVGGAWHDVSRYHCTTCGIHICEPCVTQLRRPPLWTRMPTALVPDHLENVLIRIEEPLDNLRTTMEVVLHVMALPFQPGDAGTRAARRFWQACVAASLLWWFLSWLVRDHLRSWWGVFVTVAWIAVGTLCFLSELRFFRRHLVSLRASLDLAKLAKRRARGALEVRWPFFTPDSDAVVGARPSRHSLRATIAAAAGAASRPKEGP